MSEIMAVVGFLGLLALLVPKLRLDQHSGDQDHHAGGDAMPGKGQTRGASSTT